MAPTANDLIVETQGMLRSWNQNAEQVTTLTSNITTGGLTFTVSEVSGEQLGVSSGIIEIDEELLLVSAIAADGTCTVPPWGRGFLGTTAAAHATGVRVTSQPTFPRAKVLDALNETLGRVSPDLYGVAVAEFTTTVPALTYDLPDNALNVIDARWQVPGPALYWQGVKRLRKAASGGNTPPYTNVTVDIADNMVPGRRLQITYAASPTSWVATTDTYASCLLPDSAKDVIILGAAAKLTVSQELSRLQISSIEQQDRSRLVAPSAALTSSRYLEQQYQLRLKEEAMSLRTRYPVRVMGVWV